MKITIIVIAIITYSFMGCESQRDKLGSQKFQCKNGRCIERRLTCNGRADCEDASDETYAECTKRVCPDYMFRCSYGACVNGDAICNGINDCIDGSDETLPKCTRQNSAPPCLGNQFKCDNGQCIAGYDLCDGTADCIDGSDETLRQCARINCVDIFFRCNYGACISADLKCNGVTNCVDGSDENPILCKNNTGVAADTSFAFAQAPPSTTISPTSTSTTCIVPPPPTNGYTKLYKPNCCSSTTNSQSCNYCDVPIGTKLKPGEYLVYNCYPGYELKGHNQVFCSRDGQLLNIPVCTEIRCEPLESNLRSATCQFQGTLVPCQSSVLPGTEARLKCRLGHRRDTTLQFTSEITTCNKNGQWDPQPMECLPGSITINIHTGQTVLHTDVENNSSTLVEVLPDKIIIYPNRTINDYPDIDIRVNSGNNSTDVRT
nr:PREDICTED: low-density lipoprotein receptor-related protein 2-like [Megachile rotundata]